MEWTKKRPLMQLTEADFPDAPFTPGAWARPCTTWGEYLDTERARIATDPTRQAVLKTGAGGKVALYVDRIAG